MNRARRIKKYLSVTVIPSVPPKPKIVSQKTVQEWAKKTENPDAGRHDIAAITVPFIRVDPNNFKYETRVKNGEKEFRYKDGGLFIYTWEEIFVSNRLSECEQRIWVYNHEMDHVLDHRRDNEKLMELIPKDPYMIALCYEGQWLPVDMRKEGGAFSAKLIIEGVRNTCFEIHKKLSLDSMRRRDTPHEYRRVRELILATCGRHGVRKGQRQGSRI